ncbi:MAG: Lrp/AsnC ligand binding domain-containing protein [Anaerolineae bacterium]|nr:Lrp/AsnC ligand binding domain-containing protein [Anaerolineae bacterium]
MRAYVLVNVRGGEAGGIARELRSTPGVVRADYVFGTYDVIVEVEAKDVASIGRLVFECVRVLPGVIDTQTCLAIE